MHDLASQSAARKISEQAKRDPERGEVSEDAELTRGELQELAAVLAEPRVPEDEPAYEHLRDEVTRELGDWKSGRADCSDATAR